MRIDSGRLFYCVTFLLIVFLGICFRMITVIPLWVGDFLYAVMMYILFRILFVKWNTFHTAILALITCYSIELLQLSQAEWLIEIRKTLWGKYVLGQGFLCSDIVAYTFGIAVIFMTEKLVLKKL
jgi:hypothetical protein